MSPAKPKKHDPLDINTGHKIKPEGVSGSSPDGPGYPTGFLSSCPPGLARVGNDIVMLFKEPGREITAESRICAIVMKDGEWDFKGDDNGKAFIFNHSTGCPPGGAELNGTLAVFGRHYDGQQMYCLHNNAEQIPVNTSLQAESYFWMGQHAPEGRGPLDVDGRISVTSSSANTVYAVARHFGDGNQGVMWGRFSRNGRTVSRSNGNTMLNSLYPPAVQYFKGKLYMVYAYNGVLSLATADAVERPVWTKVRDLGANTSAGPALAVCRDMLFVFYRHSKGNAILYMGSENGVDFKSPRHPWIGLESPDGLAEPAAIGLPGDHGILVACIRPVTTWNPLNPAYPEAIVYITMSPRVDRQKITKKPAKKTTAKKAVKNKPVAASKAVKKAAKKAAPAAAKKTTTPKAGKKKAVAKKKTVKKAVKKAAPAKPAKKAAKKAAPKAAKKATIKKTVKKKAVTTKKAVKKAVKKVAPSKPVKKAAKKATKPARKPAKKVTPKTAAKAGKKAVKKVTKKAVAAKTSRPAKSKGGTAKKVTRKSGKPR